jgi:hypothetical protein
VHRVSFTTAGVLTAAALTFASTPARAEGRTHDGFQFRGTVGFGYMSDAESSNATVHGPAGVLEVYVGGMPVRWLAIGGFLSGPSVSVEGLSVRDTDTRLTLVTIGPYIDYYPAPHKGLHILGTLGFASLTARYDDVNFSASNSAGGFTLGGGIGYDWWVSRDWSIGVLGRFTFASTSRTVDGFSVSESTVLPAVLFSVSYN